MMSEESDEALARRLQEQEFLASRSPSGRPPSGQPNGPTYSSGGAFSQPPSSGSSEASRYQRLSTDDHAPVDRPSRPAPSSGALAAPAPAPAPAQFLHSGQAATVRFKHTTSGSVVAEPVIARSTSPGVMQFELASAPGQPRRFLRVSADAQVEFSAIDDDTSRFLVNVLANGSVTLLCFAHQNKFNHAGVRGWYLALDAAGRLIGNSPASSQAQWMFVATQPVPPASAAASAASLGSSSSTQGTGLAPGLASGLGVGPGPVGSAASNPLHSSATSPPIPPATSSPAPAMTPAVATTPNVFAPISEQIKWLETSVGQEYLAQQPILLQLFFDGTLHKHMYRPDWPESAARFVDYSSAVNRGIKAHAVRSAPIDGFCIPDDYRAFERDGYSVLRRAVSGVALSRAQLLVQHQIGECMMPPVNPTPGGSATLCRNYALGGSIDLHLRGPILTDPDILALYYDTHIKTAVQRLLGGLPPASVPGDATVPETAHAVLAADAISVRFPPLVNMNASLYKSFVSIDETRRWCIDGFTASGDHSPYSLLVAIALSDVPGATTQDTLLEPGTTGMDFLDSDSTSRAQFVVYPGSHSKLNDIVRMQLLDGGFRYLANFSNDTNTAAFAEKPELRPKHLYLKAGDAVILSSKLAYARGLQLCCNTSTTMVIFRITHANHETLKLTALDRWYAEFALMEELQSLPQLFGGALSSSHSTGGIVDDLLSLNH